MYIDSRTKVTPRLFLYEQSEDYIMAPTKHRELVMNEELIPYKLGIIKASSALCLDVLELFVCWLIGCMLR